MTDKQLPAVDKDLVITSAPSGHWGGGRKGDKRSRSIIITVAILLNVLLAIVVVRIIQLQAYPDERVLALQEQNELHRGLSAYRGSLLDRRGRVIATSEQRYRLFVDPKLIPAEEYAEFPQKVSSALGYGDEWMIDCALKLRGRANSRYVVVDKLMDPARLESYRALSQKVSGLSIEPVMHRIYPLGKVAGQVIGFTGHDGKGAEGLERMWNGRLEAIDGEATHVINSRRKTVWISAENYRLPVDGEKVVLSIDANIQEIAERQLDATCQKHRAESGVMIVMQPYTGEILAMANWPTFDPQKVSSYSENERNFRLRNHAVADAIEPGSIFKPLVWAWLTDKGTMRPDEKVDTTRSGSYRIERGGTIRDSHPHGRVSWKEVLMYSSNIGMAKGVMREKRKNGQEPYISMLSAWGFGQVTGSGLPAEENGIMPTDWRPRSNYSITRTAIGQGIAVTPLQIMTAFCALGNDGVLPLPIIETPLGHMPPQGSARPRLVSSQTASLTRETLGKAIQEGTGRMAKSKWYDLWGKTGTAQRVNPAGGYFQNRYTSSFIAGAPVDKPRLVVGCFIVDPDRKVAHYGGVVAAPYVRNVMEASLMYMGVPTKDGTNPAELSIDWDEREQEMLEQLGLLRDEDLADTALEVEVDNR